MISGGVLWIVLLATVALAAGWVYLRSKLAAERRDKQDLEKRLEDSLADLRQSERRYRKLFERNLAGVVRATVEGYVLDCNDAFARIFGYTSREDCIRRHRLELAGDSDLLRELRKTGSYESLARTQDGSEVALLWNANVVVDETSGGVVVEGTVIDISERQRLEERLRREAKLESLAVLAGGVAHDFNNLLVGVLGNAELARVEVGPGSPVEPYLADIEATARRAANLSQKMLAYSGKGRFLTTSLDLSDAVREARLVLQRAVGEEILIDYDLASDLPEIEADPSQISQLVHNLVANAAEAIGDGRGTVSVTTGQCHLGKRELRRAFSNHDLHPGAFVFLEVTDDGCGIQADDQAKIFDPFFTTKLPGRGLGLPVVLGIVRGHAGTLEVRSEPGHGTTVRAYFPIPARTPSGPPAEAPVDDEAWRGSGKVLLVDDEPVVRRIGSRMLEMMGFEVLIAVDGREGVEVFTAHKGEIVLVLLDLTMPRLSGGEALAEMRALRPDVRIILATGYDEKATLERFSQEGLAGFIHKPYDLALLKKAVRHALTGTT